jgi:predicted MFS family arabinose efflux permease
VLYEATVGAGLPIIDTISKLRESGDQVVRIEGCPSGTLGYLFGELGRGATFSDALRAAMAFGYTEPDPREDLSGMDVARKGLILGRAMGFDGELDSVLVELAFTLGPALIALLLAVGSPTIAFGAAFVFSTLAVPTFLASPALRYWRHDPHAERHLLGPLTEPRLLAVFATTFLLTCSLGMLEIAYPGFAARATNPPLAGVLLAINSVGSAIGGLIYGGVHFALPPERQLRRVLGLLVVPIAIHAVITSAVALAIVAFIAGFLIAPTLTMVTVLVSSYAPSRYATEAFTWSATCVISGIGAGNALGGVLLERFDPAVVFGASACAALLAATCALMLKVSASHPTRPG